MSEKKTNCTEWSAIHDFMPPGPARLTVNGKCTFPTPGYKVTLKKKAPESPDPSVLLLEKTVIPPTPPSPKDVVSTVSVTPYEEVTDYRFKQVEISPDGTRIEVKDVH